MTKNRPAAETGEARQQPVGAVVLFVTLVSLSTLATAETMPKVPGPPAGRHWSALG